MGTTNPPYPGLAQRGEKKVNDPDMTEAEHINPDVLKWARETAGLTVAEAAEKRGLKDTAKMSAVEKLHALENGSRDPAPTTLHKAASLYRRPLIAVYLSAPPRRGDRATTFGRTKQPRPGKTARWMACCATFAPASRWYGKSWRMRRRLSGGRS